MKRLRVAMREGASSQAVGKSGWERYWEGRGFSRADRNCKALRFSA